MSTATPAEQAIELDARQIFETTGGSARRIDCVQGCVWITLDHDARDIVLEAGDSFVAEEGARALVYAFEPARLMLGPVSRPQPITQNAFRQRARTTAQVAV